MPLDSVIAWDSPVEIEERDSVLTVIPDVVADEDGGFLVADRSEQQVRRYSPDGALDFVFGRRGDGPQEFRRLQTVLRLPSRLILTLESDGSFKLLSADGSELLKTFSIERFRRAAQMIPLTDSTVLVAARLAERLDREQLHVVNIDHAEVSRSFFEPFAKAGSLTAAFGAGWVGFDLRGDTVAATFSVSDSVYYFDVGGAPLATVPLPSRLFRVASGEPDADVRRIPRRRAAWLASFDLIDRPRFVPQGLLISYQSILPSTALERDHHLLLMEAGGRKLWEIRGAPRLLAVVDDRPLFMSPSSEMPNQWRFARFK